MKRQSFTILGTVVAMAFLVGQANAATITAGEIDSETVLIAIEGEIITGDGERFRREAARHNNAVVVLESNGGATMEAIEIGEAIRLRGFSTLVVNGSECVSACALIWLSGTPRILTNSSRVGFHASYSNQTGQRLESGVGNALVGRYLTVLNLPMSAIIFATSAPPAELNWLNQENSRANGIEVSFIDDWQNNTSSKPQSVSAPPPIRTQPIQSNIPSVLWHRVENWSIMVDPTLGNSCFLISEFDDGTSFRIGIDRSNPGTSYFFMANSAWTSLVLGSAHEVNIKFDEEVPWVAQTTVVDMTGILALSAKFTDNQFWAEFALSNWLNVSRDSRSVTSLSLASSRAALESFFACQDYYNNQSDGRDPFAN